MPIMKILGFVLLIFVLLKALLAALSILLNKFGRSLGFGIKWIPEKDDFAIITGATGAMGREYAREFASMGFNLLLVSPNEEKLNKLTADYKERYNTKEIKSIVSDFSKIDGIDKVREAIDSLQSVAALVNCAGISFPPKDFLDYPPNFSSQLINVNLMAPVMLIEHVLPKMAAKGRGAIINFSAQTGLFRFPKYSIYAATKTFINAFSEILSIECKSKGVIVQNVCPLFVHSNLSAEVKPNWFRVEPHFAAFNAMQAVGIETTTYSHWKHRLSAMAFRFLTVILGTLWTTRVLRLILPKFISYDGKLSQTEQPTETTSQSKTTPKTSPKSSPKSSPKPHGESLSVMSSSSNIQNVGSTDSSGPTSVKIEPPPPAQKKEAITIKVDSEKHDLKPTETGKQQEPSTKPAEPKPNDAKASELKSQIDNVKSSKLSSESSSISSSTGSSTSSTSQSLPSQPTQHPPPATLNKPQLVEKSKSTSSRVKKIKRPPVAASSDEDTSNKKRHIADQSSRVSVAHEPSSKVESSSKNEPSAKKAPQLPPPPPAKTSTSSPPPSPSSSGFEEGIRTDTFKNIP